MRLELATSLQDTAADSLPTSFSAIDQLSLLSGIDTPAKCSENEQQTDGSPACTCGKETLDCLIHPSTPDKWIAFMRDSLALILALPETRQELALKQEVASTVKSSASLALLTKSESGKASQEFSYSWRTLQTSLLTDSEQFSLTWPRSGMTRNGYVYELPTVGRLTKGIDGGYLATPTCTSNQLAPSMMKHKSCRALVNAMLPTPTAHDAKKGAYPSEYNRNTLGIAVILGGKPNPTFQEWQMGWPINHTALKALEMGKCHSKPQQPTDCSEAAK